MTHQRQAWQKLFLQRHQLNDAYLDFAGRYLEIIVASLLDRRANQPGPVVVGVNGCQGSGKSTLCDYLVAFLHHRHGCSAVSLSLDDFYLRRQQRQRLAETVHPLLATRGVPGTHDMALLEATLERLCCATATAVTAIPRFDKSCDDRAAESAWDCIEGAVDIIFLEGWCMGAQAEAAAALRRPVNTLEAEEDRQGTWRSYANRVLQTDFVSLYKKIDLWLMLAAPSFDCVHRWRLEQEKKMARGLPEGPGRSVMGATEIARFIQFYQRLTENCLHQLPAKAHYLYRLGDNREVVSFRQGLPAPD